MARVDNTGGSGFTVDNGTGLVVRTKLNQIIAALSTLNQGSGTPSIGVGAYSYFVDGNTLKIQNAANNAAITLGDVSLTNFGHASLSASNTFAAATIFTEDVTLTGASANIIFDKSTDDLIFNDGAKAIFGTSSDGIEIYHASNESFIDDQGTGNLFIRSNGAGIHLKKHGTTETLAKFNTDGNNEFYFDNSKKFETSTGGVSLTGGAAANITALTDGSTIAIDMATACHHSVTLAGNRTFAAPSNQVVGQAGSIFITQDGSGSRTASFNAAFKFVGGTAPTLSTAAAAVDRIDYVILSSNVIHCAVSLDVK